MLGALDAVSERLGSAPAEVAIAWLAARPGITAPIASATGVEQVATLARAASLALDAEAIAALDQASAS